MCENLEYWMNFYVARIIKGGLIVVAVSFLFFRCSDTIQNPKPADSSDSDGDGLIDIKDATMLNNMRYNLAGTSYKTSASDAGDASGCPNGGCHGYELSADIDLLSLLDANGNGKIDTRIDKSWVPIGDIATPFTGIFEGNNHTIANLWVNVSKGTPYDLPNGSKVTLVVAGLFGVTGSTVTIRNVGIISGSVQSSAHPNSNPVPALYSGSLVGYVIPDSFLIIVNSYFTGTGGISASGHPQRTRAGGLVGGGYFTSLTIVNSYFKGEKGVSSSTYAGGLVSRVPSTSNLKIENSYCSGSGDISGSRAAGGLVASVDEEGSLTITNSIFSGSGEIVSRNLLPSSGALVGFIFFNSTIMIVNGYWNTDASRVINGRSTSMKKALGYATGIYDTIDLTLIELKATSGTYPAGLPNGISSSKAWNLGTANQLPAIKACVNPTVTNNIVTCASYGALLAGQR